MPLVPAKCPECGGFVEADNEKRAGLCQHCGQPFVIEDAIQTFNTYYNTNNITNHNYGEGTVVNVYENSTKDFVIEGGVLKKYQGASVDVVIPDGVIEIGSKCFKDLKIKSVKIPDSVISISECAFSGCSTLTSITIPHSVTYMGMPGILIEKPIFGDCISLVSINVDENNNFYSSENGVLFNKDKTILIQYPASKEDSDYVIPDSVTEIGHYAFNGCRNLKSILIPDGVTNIGGSGFQYCTNLTSLTIPDSVSVISNRAFYFCKNIASITIPTQVGFIGEEAFSNCSSLESATILDSLINISRKAFYHCEKLASLIIPNSVKSIGDWAFWGCTSLKSITIPDSVTNIGYSAFSSCENLTDVNISYALLVKSKDAFDNSLYERISKQIYYVEMQKEREKEEAEYAEYLKKVIDERKSMGLCQHCGGMFKNSLFLWVLKCSSCGKPKDY